jgi:hypothetical protein
VHSYPDNNCNAVYGGGTPAVPQEKLGGYLTHQAGQQIVAPYLNSTALAQRYSKPFIMFETNTASCGGVCVSSLLRQASDVLMAT